MQKEINSAVIFKNYTTEAFVGKWDGVQYPPFAPGQETYMELWKAMHFAKHLIDRELNKQGTVTNNQKLRRELEAKCVLFPGAEVKESEILDKNLKEEKKTKKVEEEEFTDLEKEEKKEEKAEKAVKVKK